MFDIVVDKKQKILLSRWSLGNLVFSSKDFIIMLASETQYLKKTLFSPEKNDAYKMDHLFTVVTLLFFQEVYVV